MLIDAQQQTLVSDGIPPQGWQLRVVRIWHPDLYLTEEKGRRGAQVWKQNMSVKLCHFTDIQHCDCCLSLDTVPLLQHCVRTKKTCENVPQQEALELKTPRLLLFHLTQGHL